MSKLTSQTPLENQVGGGNLGLFVQVLQTSTGGFTAWTGADALGDTAGTVHQLGSQIDSAFNRSADGQYSCPVTILEADPDHLNMLEALAPYAPNLDNPEDVLEDGTRIGGAEGVYGDNTKPFFLFVLFGKPTVAGKQKARVFVGQFERAGGVDQKAKQRAKFKFTIKSVDGQGYTQAIPTGTSARPTTGMTIPALSGNNAQGVWLIGT